MARPPCRPGPTTGRARVHVLARLDRVAGADEPSPPPARPAPGGTRRRAVRGDHARCAELANRQRRRRRRGRVLCRHRPGGTRHRSSRNACCSRRCCRALPRCLPAGAVRRLGAGGAGPTAPRRRRRAVPPRGSHRGRGGGRGGARVRAVAADPRRPARGHVPEAHEAPRGTRGAAGRVARLSRLRRDPQPRAGRRAERRDERALRGAQGGCVCLGGPRSVRRRWCRLDARRSRRRAERRAGCVVRCV